MLERILNATPTIYKWDRFFVGLLPALFLPVLSFGFFYLFLMSNMRFDTYLQTALQSSILAKIASFGCILNLAVFFVFISRDYYNAARGVIAATILWGIPIVYAKFFM
ncbi:MAG: hypothetical protein NZM35_01310 [Chitinophagales bacterium]|nr:hypothetical protein [Chitinophagales bacterium]MDW8419719.1 hypothetical protein [Chitinophagales bacterium]